MNRLQQFHFTLVCLLLSACDPFDSLLFGVFNDGTPRFDVTTAVMVQSDGKIVSVGTATLDDGKNRWAIARHLPDGRLDTGFAGVGYRTISFLDNGDIPFSVAHAKDGKILVGGFTTDLIPTQHGVVARLLENGALDSTFGIGGIADFGISMIVRDVAELPDGKLLAFGNETGLTGLSVVRLFPGGTIDPSFGTAGQAKIHVDGTRISSAQTMTVLSDGRIIVCGGIAQNPLLDPTFDLDGVIYRLQADGSLDSSFGTGGMILERFSAQNQEVQDIAFLEDGRLLASGYTTTDDGSKQELFVARYLSTGAPDPAFGTQGKTRVSNPEFYQVGGANLMVRPDQTFFTVGSGFDARLNSSIILTHFTSGGQVDTAFTPEGYKIIRVSGETCPGGLPVQAMFSPAAVSPAGDRFYVGGAICSSGRAEFALAAFWL